MRAKNLPQAPQLVEVLFGAYRRQILALLLLRADESFHVREIGRLTGPAEWDAPEMVDFISSHISKQTGSTEKGTNP